MISIVTPKLTAYKTTGEAFEMLPHVVLRRHIYSGSLSQRSVKRDAGYLKVARRALELRRLGGMRDE